MNAAFRILVSVVLVLVLSVPAWSASTTIMHSGDECQATNPYSASGIYVSSPGIENIDSSGTAYEVFCPLMGFPFNTDVNPVVVDSVTIYYDDQDSSLELDCWLTLTNWGGGVHWSSTLYSCSTSGGCSNGTSANYTGGNTLAWSPPYGSTTYYPVNLAVGCNLPGNYSNIWGYSVTIN